MTFSHLFNYLFSNGTTEITIIELLASSGEISSNAGKQAANTTWKKVKDNWLWVDNIWVADSYKSPLPTYAVVSIP